MTAVGERSNIYRDGKAFEVEFTTLEGHTAAVATVEATQVREVSRREITHARTLEPTGVGEGSAEHGK